MSASREKKQRQGGTPSNRTQAIQQQEAETRRKTIQYTVIGVIVAILVAALLIWNSGFFQRRATAVTVNGTNYTVGEVSYYYYSAYQETAYYAQYMAQFGMGSGYDTSLSPKDQTYSTDSETGEVTTYHDYFIQSAMSRLETVTALYDAAIADGYSKADVKDAVTDSVNSAKETAKTNGYSSFDQFLAANYGKYVTASVFEDVLTRSELADQYYSDHQDALSYSDEELQSYYEEHANELDTFVFSYLYLKAETVSTTDEDGNTIEMTDEEREAAEAANLEAAKALADEVKEKLEDGEDAADLIEEYEPSSSGADSEMLGSNLNSLYSEWLTDSSRKSGDVEVIENSTSGYYVVQFQNRYLDQTPTADSRHILIRADVDSGADAPTDEQMTAAKTRAEEIYSQWQTGAATEESFAALADENSADGGSNTNGGLYEATPKGNFVPNYDAWMFEEGRKYGDTTLVENNGDGGYYGYHVIFYVGENDPVWKNTVRETLAKTATSEWLEGLTEGYTATEANGISYVNA